VDGNPILICYDGSEGARRGVATAGRAFAGRNAVVLDVGPLPMVAETYAALGSGAAGLDRVVLDTATARADEGARLARAAGLRASGRATIDAPVWHSVRDVAEEIDAAAIVVGSGALARDLVRHAGRPVLIVPAD
jgi:nucleotide-binding universal stress UspA family protein